MGQQRNDLFLSMVAGTQSVAAVIDLALISRLTLQAVYQNATTTAKTFTYSGTANTITMANHGQTTGSKGQVSTTVALPSGLLVLTDYYVVVIDANTIKLATSLANALAGTVVAITTAGTGTHTFTPTALAGTLKCQVSNDAANPTNWTDCPGTTVAISGSGSTFWSSHATYTTGGVTTPQIDPEARFLQVIYTPTAGQLTLGVAVCAARAESR